MEDFQFCPNLKKREERKKILGMEQYHLQQVIWYFFSQEDQSDELFEKRLQQEEADRLVGKYLCKNPLVEKMKLG